MTRPALRIAALGFLSILVLGATAAEARTRTFCAQDPYYGGEQRDCGGHLQPACTSGDACDPGHGSYSGSPFPLEIDCPTIRDPLFGSVIVDIPDVTVHSGCYDERPDCSACGGPNEPPCPGATAPWCTVGCQADLEPDPGTTLCRTPGTPGLPCGPGFGCGPGLTCDETQLRCVAFAQAGESCVNPFVGCAPGLTCTAAFECAHNPALLGETCDAITGVSCDEGLYCKAGIPQRCHAKRKPGEACGIGAACMEGASCLACPAEGCDAPFQCFPDEGFVIPGLPLASSAPLAASPQAQQANPVTCSDMYSVKQGRRAKERNHGWTVGIGGEAALIVGASFETGVAYGSEDEFGCYRTVCQGLNFDAAVEAFVALSEVDTYASIAGNSAVLFEEVQWPGSLFNFAAGQIWSGAFSNLPLGVPEDDPGLGPFLGTSWAFAIGIGPNPSVIAAGAYNCETTLTDIPTLASVAEPAASSPAEASFDPVDVAADTGSTAAAFVPGTGALFFDGVDDALAVTEAADLAFLGLVRPEYLAWRDRIDACKSTPVQAEPFSLCRADEPILWPSEAECQASRLLRTVRYRCNPPLPDLDVVINEVLPGGPPPAGDGVELTLEAWIRPDVGALQSSAIIAGQAGSYALRMVDGEIAWTLAHTGGGAVVKTGFAPPLGLWTHVALVYDGTGVRTYVDAEPVHWAEALGAVGDLDPGDDAWTIGGSLAGDAFAGQIDGVRLWARALDAGDLRRGLTQTPPASAPGLIASWEFFEQDEHTILGQGPDPIAIARDGLGAGRAPLRTAEDRRREGGALAFDGVDDHVSVTDPEALAGLAVSEALTVEAWVRPNGPGNHPNFGGVIASKEGEWWFGRAADGRLNYAIANASPGWSTRTTDVVVPQDDWSHVALTYDAALGEVRVFLDGVLAHTGAASGAIGDFHPGAPELRIGGRQNDELANSNQRFQGLIDEVRVWRIARTPDQIADHVAAPVGAGAEGLLGFWRFDEGPAGIAFDASLGRHHARLGSGRVVQAPKRSDALAYADYPSGAAAAARGASCGLGFEPAALLPVWMWMRRRRSR